MRLPEIKGFLETSFVDWPGRLASVVFLPGCNFRCPYCHNHRLVLNPGDLATWPLDAILWRLEEFRGWIDGVCVTGGEPTIHDALPDFLSLFRSRGWALKLDTNGLGPKRSGASSPPASSKRWRWTSRRPSRPCRTAETPARLRPEAVAETLGVLADWGGWLEVRTTVHPDLLSRDELCRLAAQTGLALSAPPGTRFTPSAAGPTKPWTRRSGEAFRKPRGVPPLARQAREQFTRAAAAQGRG